MSYTTAKALHKPSGYSLLISCSFDKSENKQTYYIGRDCFSNYNHIQIHYETVLFHNGSVYGYRFIVKSLAKEFKGNFECLGENTEKYISFIVPFKKVINDK